MMALVPIGLGLLLWAISRSQQDDLMYPGMFGLGRGRTVVEHDAHTEQAAERKNPAAGINPQWPYRVNVSDAQGKRLGNFAARNPQFAGTHQRLGAQMYDVEVLTSSGPQAARVYDFDFTHGVPPGPSALDRAQAELDAIEARMRARSAELDRLKRSVQGDDPTIQIWLEPTELGGTCCVAGVTWPNGHYSEWRNSVEPIEVGFSVEDAFAAAQQIVGLEVGKRTSTDKLSPEQGAHRIRLSWRSLKNAKEQDRPKLWKLDAPTSLMEQWWQAIGKEKRRAYKIRYAAIMDNAPATATTDDQKNTWWHSLKKDQRGKFRDPYESDFLEDLGETLGDVAKFAAPIVEASAIQAADIIVPGSGQALKKGVSAAKQVAKDVKAAEKKIQQVKEVATAATSAVAKAKTITDVAKTLSSPVTQRALATVGVPAAATQKAAQVFQGIRNASAAVALQKKGNTEAAKAYAKAAEANAIAANIPVSRVAEGGKRLYYLALTPGG